jgi:hypothetical protein
MTDADGQDGRAQLKLWAHEALGRSAARTAQASRAARSAGMHWERANQMIERLAERNPAFTEHLLAIRAMASGRLAAIAERQRGHATFLAGDQSLTRPLQPEAAIVVELETYLREMAAIIEGDRIADKLRTNVIQQIFAAGLALQCAAGLTTQPDVRSRIEAAADGLDVVIRMITDAIWGPADRPAGTDV